MEKAAFLDRDGVLIEEKGHYNYRSDDISIVEGSVEALQKLQKAGFLLIVISNQGGIAKGIYKKHHVHEMHKNLLHFYKSYGIKISEIYYCPHHSDIEKCLCRKPDSLLLEKAMAFFKIDKKQSFMIGDQPRDIEAAQKAGVKGILIKPNQNLNEIIDDLI